METIRVYHSLKKSTRLVAGCFAFAAIGIYLLNESSESSRFVAWLCILFFGIGGLFMLGFMLKERVTHTPYYTITRESISMNSGVKTWEVRFTDVERFFLSDMGTAKMIGIQYRKDVERQKFEGASAAGRTLRRFNESMAGSQEALPADDLTISPQQLCELLNERVTLLRSV